MVAILNTVVNTCIAASLQGFLSCCRRGWPLTATVLHVVPAEVLDSEETNLVCGAPTGPCQHAYSGSRQAHHHYPLSDSNLARTITCMTNTSTPSCQEGCSKDRADRLHGEAGSTGNLCDTGTRVTVTAAAAQADTTWPVRQKASNLCPGIPLVPVAHTAQKPMFTPGEVPSARSSTLVLRHGLGTMKRMCQAATTIPPSLCRTDW